MHCSSKSQWASRWTKNYEQLLPRQIPK
jgi:hypothetical protein